MSLTYHEEQMRLKQKQPKEKPRRIPIREQLLAILDELPTLITTAGQGFACIPCPGAQSSYNVSLKSQALKDWILARALNRDIPVPSAGQLRDALRAFEARCRTASLARRSMSVRTAWNPTYMALDPETNRRINCREAIVVALDARTGRHAIVTPDGWTLDASTATPFVYDPIQQPLPEPDPAASNDSALTAFHALLSLNQPTHDKTWATLLTWTLTALSPARHTTFHDYPILNLTGPGASLTARLLTHLLDPTGTPIHSLPSTERRLHALAATHHVLTFDDPGQINPEKSRYLSHLSRGVSSLHPHLEGMLCRPIILATNRPNETKHLAHCVVDVELPAPAATQEVVQRFEALRAPLLGALLTLLARNFDQPPTLLPNRKTKIEKIEESVPTLLIENGGTWKGTITDLLARLHLEVSAKALRQTLNQMPGLAIQVRKSGDTRTVVLTLPQPVAAPKPTVHASLFFTA